MVVLLLAANRYFAVCRVRAYDLHFSNHRIKKYAFGIFIASLIAAVANQTNYCFFDLQYPTLADIYEYISLFWYVSFNLPMVALTVILYIKIRSRMKRQICMNEYYNAASRGALAEDIQTEKSYLRAVMISTIITVPLLILDFLINLSTIIFSLTPADFFTERYSNSFIFDGRVLLASLVGLLFVINPFIFYFTNEDFKIKLKRPIREFKKRLSIGPQMRTVDLNTTDQPMTDTI